VKKEDLLLFPNAKQLILHSKKCVDASDEILNTWDLSDRAYEIELAYNGKYTNRSQR
jgi:hypothetical protein